ncbi:MAG TPA: hypothetical protein VMG12_19700 [Polyangiaceae bacterium]|nr:hypothetical protein [Polyangiaceae bacterium]
MKTNWLKFAGALSLSFAGSLMACGAGDIENADGVNESSDEAGYSVDESIELGTAEQGVMNCTNLDGTNSAMAAFAVAVAKELGRWQVGKDFVVVKSNGQTPGTSGQMETLALSSGSDASGPKGSSRCQVAGCPNINAILAWQYSQYNNQVYFQGSGSYRTLLSPTALASRMVAKYREQGTCDTNAKDGDSTQCPKEEHKLTYVSSASGGCDRMFTFNVKRTDGTALKYPNQLKHKLRFADVTNPYINFTPLANGDISIDPTWGLNPDGTTSSGSCSAACTMVTTTNVAGSCCSCGGVNKTFVRSTFNTNTYLCQ